MSPTWPCRGDLVDPQHLHRGRFTGQHRVHGSDHRVMAGVPATAIRVADGLRRAVVVEAANAISRLARSVTRARGGIDGADSVNDFRLQEAFLATIFSFPPHDPGDIRLILMSRGRVLTQPFDRDDRDVQSGTLPPTRQRSGRDGAGSVDIDVHGLHDDTVESEQQGTTSLRHPRAFASGCVKNTQFTRALAPNQSPTRSGSVTPDPQQVGSAGFSASIAEVPLLERIDSPEEVLVIAAAARVFVDQLGH